MGFLEEYPGPDSNRHGLYRQRILSLLDSRRESAILSQYVTKFMRLVTSTAPSFLSA